MRPRHRLRRSVAFAVDAAVLPLVLSSLFSRGPQAGAAGLIGCGLVLWLIYAFRSQSSVGYWTAIVVNLAYFALSVTFVPLFAMLLAVVCALFVVAGSSPGTSLAVLTVSTTDGEPAELRVAQQRSALGLIQATLIASAIGFAAVNVGIVVGGSVGAVAGLAVVVANVVGGQFLPHSVLDQLAGTRLTYARSPQLPPIPLNPYASALWGSTVGLDLDLAPPELDEEPPSA